MASRKLELSVSGRDFKRTARRRHHNNHDHAETELRAVFSMILLLRRRRADLQAAPRRRRKPLKRRRRQGSCSQRHAACMFIACCAISAVHARYLGGPVSCFKSRRRVVLMRCRVIVLHVCKTIEPVPSARDVYSCKIAASFMLDIDPHTTRTIYDKQGRPMLTNCSTAQSTTAPLHRHHTTHERPRTAQKPCNRA